jgi:hypothetical protein
MSNDDQFDFIKDSLCYITHGSLAAEEPSVHNHVNEGDKGLLIPTKKHASMTGVLAG